jgi:hypothetical protein
MMASLLDKPPTRSEGKPRTTNLQRGCDQERDTIGNLLVRERYVHDRETVLRHARNRTPRTMPNTVPHPPAKETPPSRTAVRALSSIPTPRLLDGAASIRAMLMMPAKPAAAPLTINSRTRRSR